MPQKRLLVTAALPYANGPIHLGHLVESIQTDIFVRFQRLQGREVLFVCADDTHGTAIMMRARQEGRSEEALIAEMSRRHQSDFTAFSISFDHYGSTHSEENRQLCHRFWKSMRDAGRVVQRDVVQLYDPQAGTFLADRFVKGTCPKCGSPDQFGDNCIKCNATYNASELIDPVSKLSGATPEVRSAPHWFIELEPLREILEGWIGESGALQPEVANYLKGNFLSETLKDWDVSRPAPYFGFEIPDAPGHYWYVWFDAPIGYIASTSQWCQANGQTWERWWNSEEAEVHHFIGKDITYFHTLFWPGMLHTAGLPLPSQVHIHGFLTVGGEKMSKSAGTLVKAATYLDHLDPSYLRYYYASKLGSGLDDLDLNLEEFVLKVNADVVNKVVNLASRTARFAQTTGLSTIYPHDGGLFQAAARAGESIAQAYHEGDTAKAMRLVMELADQANPFVENAKPWLLQKDPSEQQRLQDVCTIALNLFRQLAIYLAPVLPKLAEQCGTLLGDPIVAWSQSQQPLVGTPVAPFEHLMQRVTREKVDAMMEQSAQEAQQENPADSPTIPVDSDQYLSAEPLAETCTIDDFAKVDLRVARVLKAEQVPEARKLLKLTVSLGGDHVRTVFAGIKAAYEPEALVGRLVVIVANLQPRQMKFGLSEGMVTAAGAGGAEVFLLAVDSGAAPGMRVH
ncbi:MAG: methionine--tRNA ligase [Pirellulaceae bacterium]|jgi:methionyl-tRNA synthetase